MSEPFGQYPHGTYGAYPVPEPPRRRRSRHVLGLTATAVVAAAVGAGAVAGLSHGPAAGAGATATSKQVLSAAQIASRVDPAIVDVTSTLGYQQATAKGTGIVLTSTGEILTNNHVINGATSITVTDVANGKTYKATVVGYAESKDIAVLQLSGASGLTVASTGDSSAVTVGSAVTALGNAGGTDGTPSVAAGTVTALNQSITASDESSGTAEQLTGLIETNASIQAGDSGGPMANEHGQIIGIDTAASTSYAFGGSGGNGYGGFGGGSSGSSGSSGSAPVGQTQGYAIPINTALSIARQIEAGQGSATVHIGGTAFLGVEIAGSSGQGSAGVTLAGARSGTPAAAAGLAAGDVITAINGTPVSTGTQISQALIARHPGDKISIGWTDTSGSAHTATVTLTTGPAA